MSTRGVHLPNKTPYMESLNGPKGRVALSQRIRGDLAEAKKCFRWAFGSLKMAVISFRVLLKIESIWAIRRFVHHLAGFGEIPLFPHKLKGMSSSSKQHEQSERHLSSEHSASVPTANSKKDFSK